MSSLGCKYHSAQKIVKECGRKLLPWDGGVNFIKKNDFGGSFLTSNLNDLGNFFNECENPLFEFIDPDLEGLRINLIESIDIFLTIIASETFPTNNNCNSIPREMSVHDSKRFKEICNSINEKADKIYNDYETLIRTSMRKLGVFPYDK